MDEERNLTLDVDEAGLKGSGQRVARVAVTSAHSFTRSGVAPTITADCTDFQALELEVQRLRGELDAVLSEATTHFEAARREREASNAERRSAAADLPDKAHIEADLRVADAMTRGVKTVGRNDQLSVAEELMKVGHFRHVVVLDDLGKVAGVISQRDLFYGALAWSMGQGKFAHDNALKTLTAKEIMHEDPVVVSPEVPLTEAAGMMLADKLGCLPVIEGDELVGILTEGDFLLLLA